MHSLVSEARLLSGRRSTTPTVEIPAVLLKTFVAADGHTAVILISPVAAATTPSAV